MTFAIISRILAGLACLGAFMGVAYIVGRITSNDKWDRAMLLGCILLMMAYGLVGLTFIAAHLVYLLTQTT